MIRKLATAAAAGAIALSGLVAFGVGSASAASIQITATTGSHITCSAIKSKAVLSVALRDPWVQSDHSGDSDPSFAAIPDNNSWVLNGPVLVSAPKAKATSCTGTVTDGAGHTASVKEVDLALSTDPAHPGSPDPATCAGLVAPTGPSTAQFTTSITYKSATKGFTIAPTAGTGLVQSSEGAGFRINGGTLTGSFAGSGHSSTLANVDSKTLTAFLSSSALTPRTSANAGTKFACQASAKNKKGVWSLKAPKGITKLGIASGSVDLSK
ncbi:MAG TPA: hypothetical protein VGN59_18460 [Acidimicrobiia bacterium]|jgi:hypothetical protein